MSDDSEVERIARACGACTISMPVSEGHCLGMAVLCNSIVSTFTAAQHFRFDFHPEASGTTGPYWILLLLAFNHRSHGYASADHPLFRTGTVEPYSLVRLVELLVVVAVPRRQCRTDAQSRLCH